MTYQPSGRSTKKEKKTVLFIINKILTYFRNSSSVRRVTHYVKVHNSKKLVSREINLNFSWSSIGYCRIKMHCFLKHKEFEPITFIYISHYCKMVKIILFWLMTLFLVVQYYKLILKQVKMLHYPIKNVYEIIVHVFEMRRPHWKSSSAVPYQHQMRHYCRKPLVIFSK